MDYKLRVFLLFLTLFGDCSSYFFTDFEDGTLGSFFTECEKNNEDIKVEDISKFDVPLPKFRKYALVLRNDDFVCLESKYEITEISFGLEIEYFTRKNDSEILIEVILEDNVDYRQVYKIMPTYGLWQTWTVTQMKNNINNLKVSFKITNGNILLVNSVTVKKIKNYERRSFTENTNGNTDSLSNYSVVIIKVIKPIAKEAVFAYSTTSEIGNTAVTHVTTNDDVTVINEITSNVTTETTLQTVTDIENISRSTIAKAATLLTSQIDQNVTVPSTSDSNNDVITEITTQKRTSDAETVTTTVRSESESVSDFSVTTFNTLQTDVTRPSVTQRGVTGVNSNETFVTLQSTESEMTTTLQPSASNNNNNDNMTMYTKPAKSVVINETTLTVTQPTTTNQATVPVTTIETDSNDTTSIPFQKNTTELVTYYNVTDNTPSNSNINVTISTTTQVIDGNNNETTSTVDPVMSEIITTTVQSFTTKTDDVTTLSTLQSSTLSSNGTVTVHTQPTTSDVTTVKTTLTTTQPTTMKTNDRITTFSPIQSTNSVTTVIVDSNDTTSIVSQPSTTETKTTETTVHSETTQVREDVTTPTTTVTETHRYVTTLFRDSTVSVTEQPITVSSHDDVTTWNRSESVTTVTYNVTASTLSTRNSTDVTVPTTLNVTQEYVTAKSSTCFCLYHFLFTLLSTWTVLLHYCNV